MLYAKIKNYKENLIDKDRMVINLISPEDITIEPKQVKFLEFNDWKYELGEDVIGFAYSNKFDLYAPYKFI